MELLNLIVFLFFMMAAWIMGAVSGWNARERHAKRVVQEYLSEEGNLDQELEEMKNKYQPIKIEKHDNGYFVYSMPENTFMAQGATRQEVEANLEKRFPGKRYAATPENLKEVGFDV
jgi:hypothetical protein